MSHKDETLTLICTIVGCIGLVNIIILGINITKYFLMLAQILPSLLTEAIIVAIATIISSTMLLVGTYFINKSHERGGGILNIIAGLVTISTYIYYANSWEVIFLTQIGAFGYIMLIPAPISGILAILISKEKGMRTSIAEEKP